MNIYPPSVPHPSSSTPLDIPSACAFLADLLRLANLDPAYRPDSTLSDHGPQSNSSSGNPNLILHHLNRIKLGLEGNHLGAETLASGQLGKSKVIHTEEVTATKKRKWYDRDAGVFYVRTGIPEVISTAEDRVDTVLISRGSDFNSQKVAKGDGWQDREDFELAQDDTGVDVNNAQRDPTAASMEGVVEEIMDEKMKRMIGVRRELEEEEEKGKAGMEVIGHAAYEQQIEEEQERVDMSRTIGLTPNEKEERRKRKKLRMREEKISKNVANTKGQTTMLRQDDSTEAKSLQKRRKKLKSRPDEQL